MLPKVASHILQHTSRAVAAVQSQTSSHIRNVLQLQSSSGAGSGSSGPGGAKFNAGSRFNHGYTGAGRAVTHANAITSHDTTTLQSDEPAEDLAFKRITLLKTPRRSRSHSLSSGPRDRNENLSVLQTVQLHHARARHAFAQPPQPLLTCADEDLIVPSHPVLVRRNSTAVSGTTAASFDALPPPSPLPQVARAPSPTDPATPQSTSPPQPPTSEHFKLLKAARGSNDSILALHTVDKFRATATAPTVAEFNMAIEALYETRKAGDPLNPILETYNDMISRSLLPNSRTYILLINALTDRDYEVHKAITSLQIRSKRRELAGRIESALHSSDEQRIEQLKAENNFGSAMALFEAVVATKSGVDRLPLSIFLALLRSCSYHTNVDAAIHVYAQLERRTDMKPSASVFSHLISVYINAGDLAGAKEVFAEFRNAAAAGGLAWLEDEASPSKRHTHARNAQLTVWNKMLEAYLRCGEPANALGLLEQMMDSPAGADAFGPGDVPPPASSTFTTIITGFVQSGDVVTALAWFDRLLLQDEAARHPFESSAVPPRPDQIAWIVTFDALAQAGMVKDLNRLFAVLLENASRDGLEIRAVDRVLIFRANMQEFEKNPDGEDGLERLNFVMEKVVFGGQEGKVALRDTGIRDMVEEAVVHYLRLGALDKAVSVIEQYVDLETIEIREGETNKALSPSQVLFKTKGTRRLVLEFTMRLLNSALPFDTAIRLARISDKVGMLPSRSVAPFYLHSYALAKEAGQVKDLSTRDLDLLAYAATTLELSAGEGEEAEVAPRLTGYAFKGTASLLEDFVGQGVKLYRMEPFILKRVIEAVVNKLGDKQAEALFARLGPKNETYLIQGMKMMKEREASIDSRTLSQPQDAIGASDGETKNQIHIDVYHSRFIDEFYPVNHTVTPLVAYSRFQAGLAKAIYPTPATIGRLINALGRLGELEKVQVLYAAGQRVLTALEHDKVWQSQGWFQIEDQMVIAYAHAGDVESAHVHRARILEQGGAPTADAYGALIQCVKDTTDDTSSALALFQESQMQGVAPNIYLYNNIISKLAKARKADFALELFQQMKANAIQPSSITYGAVIAACARVGDAHSAELLFGEMSRQRNFKPRIPPYNTMMQLYTQTKPDRERALFYYDAMVKANIKPSAHTYKLLIDVYGTIEPVDPEAMEGVFKILDADRSVQLQGSHWAALINAWGCVVKDLDKAIAVFDSISSHPSSKRSATSLPDAVTFEAIINVLVTHRRTDLIPHYIERMGKAGVHMTAYIANFLIKGYATVGDLEQARSIFELLADPAEGVAAPNNHVPHEPSPPASVPMTAPVYREPSTWEVMVRAELGSGNRDRAVALLERLQARKYPAAVYNRISGIMLDDSAVSPWTSEAASVESP